MDNQNNTFQINHLNDHTEIDIQFEKSKYFLDIFINILVLSFFWIAGISDMYDVFFGDDTNASGFLMLWAAFVCTFTYLTIENILWLSKGTEKIYIDQNKITITKYMPLYFLKKNCEETQTVLFEDFDKMYYSEYYANKSQLPRPKKGNLHLKSKSNTLSFGITLEKADADLIFNEIQKYKDQLTIEDKTA
ncbi:hypothetical protein [Acinetobacter wuhouensis]|uniref:Uncharacterized protein n=1 Tax=Acinetobacter wuhouensis TaxID=1879050 RepID=A0A4Q7APL2_9GAMM|nr:hypothetical protein [Acinetobacter wuhouensis]RZG49261.1 hypothetical protein EXU28_00200 [Acinetobacter wuhouensis]RZG75169.1 hypothetical protein EXU29_02215 [Acinetobacter wuhouensis]